jgi:hypothetical protein
MDELEELYYVIIEPENILSFFKTDDEFRAWCETGSYEDLDETRKAFEENELYEQCAIIKSVMDDLKSA